MLTRLTIIGAFAVASLAVSGCASSKKVYLEGTMAAPAAVARVSYKLDKNKNTEVDLEVKHLTPAERLQRGELTYVVWAAPLGTEDYTRHGDLTVGADRKGSIRFVTPLNKFKLLVTAEKSPVPAKPGKEVVLQGVVDASY